MRLKKLMAFALGVMLTFQAVPVYAGTFSDLKDSEWAEPFIEKMASKGIITGFNGQYKPVDSVNKYSAVVMIYRTLKAAGKLDEAAVNAAVSKHADTISANKVPAWPDLHQAVAWMLENGVFQPDELKYFMSGENHINARRYELSIFLGKALNVFLKENINTVISLSFKDANLISSGSAPYVNLLVNKKVLQGDLEGNFKPYDPMNRAAMAKVLSVSYDLLTGTAPITEVPTTPVVVPTTPVTPVVTVPAGGTTRVAVLAFVLPDSNKVIVADKTDAAKTEIFSLEGVSILINGKTADVDDLDKNTEVQLTFSGTQLIRLEAGSFYGEVKGALREAQKMTNAYRIVITEEESGDRKTYYTAAGMLTASVDGVSTGIDKLKTGDELTLRFNDLKQISSMTVNSRYHTYEGILKSQLSFVGKPQITLKLEDNKEVSLEMDTRVDIERNEDGADFTDLVPGDFIIARTSYGKVDRIDAFSAAKTDVEGTIQQIVIGKVNKITVLTEDDVEKEFTVAANAIIEVDNDDTDIYGLRVGYSVEMEVEGSMAIEIEAEEDGASEQMSGTVSKVYKDLSVITLKQMISGTAKYTSISYNSATKIVTTDGDTLRVSNLEEGDALFITGAYRDSFFLAEKITVIE